MKTQEIKNVLKADLLVAELAEGCEYSLYDDMLYLWNDNTDNHKRFKGSYTLLGKPDEISEEDAAELVEPPIDKWGDDKFRFLDYRHDGYYDLFTATESLLSAIETQVYWENPIPTPEIQGGYDEFGNFQGGWDDNWISEFEKAESRTFDRTRTLIFKKN